MGLKSTFSLAGLQTTTTRFNKHGLSYINTHTEKSSVDEQRKKKHKEERGEQSEDKMQQEIV